MPVLLSQRERYMCLIAGKAPSATWRDVRVGVCTFSFVLLVRGISCQLICSLLPAVFVTRRAVPPKRWAIRVCLVLMTCAGGEPVNAADREQQRARTMLETMCGRCHAVGRTGQSLHADAPPFRTFGENKLYDSDLAQRLQDGLTSIHRDMPTFKFNRSDASAAINYLKSIQDHRKSTP